MKSVIVGLLLLGCVTATAQEYKTVRGYGQRAVQPTELHYGIFLMTQACTGQEGNWEAIQWFVADSLIVNTGERVWGIWTSEEKIVLDRGLYILPGLVAHELMHHLYKGNIPPDVERRCTLNVNGDLLRRILG